MIIYAICWGEISKKRAVMNIGKNGDQSWSIIAEDAKEDRVYAESKSLSLKRKWTFFSPLKMGERKSDGCR